MSGLLKSSTTMMRLVFLPSSPFVALRSQFLPSCASFLAIAQHQQNNSHIIKDFRLSSRALSSSAKKDDALRRELESLPEKVVPKYRGKTEDYKNKIYLKDMAGRMLGLKTRQEAQTLATKHRLVLVEDDSTKKIPTLRLSNPRGDVHQLDEEMLEMDIAGSSEATTGSDVDSESSSDDAKSSSKPRANQPHKHLVFNSKLSQHDLLTKIRQTKKWAAQGKETLIKVNAIGPNDSAKLMMIDKEFQQAFNNPTVGTKINQYRLTDKDLKINVVPVDLKLIARSLKQEGVDLMDDSTTSLDQIDANQLLNDESIVGKIADSAFEKNKK